MHFILVSNDDGENENGPLDKKIKSETGNQEWQWEDDGHVWKPFSDDIAKEIKDAFISKMKKTKVEINDVKFDIIFERMVQRNSKTFWERRIRVSNDMDDGGLSG